jgi:hypothetical protein
VAAVPRDFFLGQLRCGLYERRKRHLVLLDNALSVLTDNARVPAGLPERETVPAGGLLLPFDETCRHVVIEPPPHGGGVES